MKLSLPKKNIKGLRLAASYGFIPNKLGFCGPQAKNEQRIIYSFLAKGTNEGKIRNTLERFEGASTYYKLIARKNNIKDIFDYRVVEAYWIGNELLEKISAGDIKKTIRDKFVSLTLLNREEAEKRISKIPVNAKPHHSFHVLIFGTVTGRIDLNSIKLKDICRVGWGRVAAIGKKSKGTVQEIAVEYKPLVKNSSHISFGKAKTKKINWDKKIIPELKIGSRVAFHWNYAVQALTQENIKNLEKYTKLSF